MSDIPSIGGEFGLIDRITKEFTSEEVITGVGDDCAVIREGGGRVLLVTTDMLVEGHHFKKEWSTPVQIGFKAMEANVSDIAAMGGLPRWAFVSIAIPGDLPVEDVEDIYRGMNASCNDNGVVILGGDTTMGELLTVNITLLGECEEEGVRYRSGARPDELICVTGDLGRSMAGLQCLTAGIKDDFRRLVRSHLEPISQVGLAREIAPHAGAMIDISDGIASEVGHICDASGVGALLYTSMIPVAEDTRMAARKLDADPVEWALTGGEDFQLLFTTSQDGAGILGEKDVPFSVIGKIRPSKEGRMIEAADGSIRGLAGGFDHFRK